MKHFSSMSVAAILLVGALAAAGSVSLIRPTAHPHQDEGMNFWEGAARGLVRVTMVDVTYERGDHTVTAPVGVRVDNAADVPVVIPEEALLMNPHPARAPPDPAGTTQDAVLPVHTIPAGGSVLFSFGEEVLRGFLDGPPWWCSEEFQFTQADVEFRVGGETLPFALRPLLADEYYDGTDANTQADFWRYMREHATVVVGKDPLWTAIDASPGQRIPVTLAATNLAIYTFEDGIAVDVNVTDGVLEDDIPAGWAVEEGSYSTMPDEVAVHDDGSMTIRWVVDLPAALESDSDDPTFPTDYETVTRSYVLVSPQLSPGRVELPRARSDMNADGEADAHSAPALVDAVLAGAPIADAGGPYEGIEGDTIVLSAIGSTDPEGDPLQYRWDFTNDGTFDTDWSSDPIADARYTDDFVGVAAVEVTDGTHVSRDFASVRIDNAAPEIRSLLAFIQAAFRLEVAGERWHDVRLTMTIGAETLASLEVIREPGSPSAQAAETDVLTWSLDEVAALTIEYTPLDDRVNGRPPGDNPVWLHILFPDGRDLRIAHNFNTQHPSTWVWTYDDLTAFFLREGITFRAGLYDAGSDDLTTEWDFGDGATDTRTYFNDGIGPDGPESQGGIAPFHPYATAVHGYRGPGTYVVVLTVRDDDGGVAEIRRTWDLR